jgi:hypothetical protein
MYIVSYKDREDVVVENLFETLALALAWASTLSEFVTIRGGKYDIVGKFGVDSIVDGKCPDGVVYSWKKRR